MDVIELRIGNYIMYEQTTHIVTAIDEKKIHSWWVKDGKPVIEYHKKDVGGTDGLNPYFDSIENYKPILLTREWMLNFGFELFAFGWELNGFLVNMDVSDGKLIYWATLYDGKYISFEYVHTLQNFFDLTSEKLTINK